jgi:putative transposase
MISRASAAHSQAQEGQLFPGVSRAAPDGREGADAVIQEAYIQGVSTRSVDAVVQAMGMSSISKSQVSRLCGEIDGRIEAFLNRPLEGDWPYLWLDATYLKGRIGGRIVSTAVIVAVAVSGDGRREVLGMDIGQMPWSRRRRSRDRPGSAG